MKALGVTAGGGDLEKEFGALFHDLLDLQEAGSIHEEKLVPHRHAETACVAERQNLLEALGLHGRRELHYGGAALIAATTSTIAAAAEKVPEIRTAGSQNSSMSLEGMALDHHGHIAVEALQPLLVQTL